MFKFRAISFPILFAVFAIIIFGDNFGKWIFAILAPIMLGMVVYEFLTMLQGVDVKSFPKTTAIVTVILSSFISLISMRLLSAIWLFVSIPLIVIAIFGNLLLVDEKTRRDFIAKALNSFAVFALIGICYLPLMLIYFVDKPQALLFLVLTTKMTDTGGYIAGMLSNRYMKNGNHKIFPKISPKKSYEGTLGGVALSMIVGVLLFWGGFSPFEFWLTLLASFVFALGSFAGDLTESAIKRTCNVKDSGNIIPGMGGVFDLLDSFIYNGILYFFIVLMMNC